MGIKGILKTIKLCEGHAFQLSHSSIELFPKPDLSKITNSTEPLPFGLTPSEVINRLNDLDDITHLQYTKKLLKFDKSFIIDCFWHQFFQDFQSSVKFFKETEKSRIDSIVSYLKTVISNKFLSLVLYSEGLTSFKSSAHKNVFNQFGKILALITYSIFCHAWPDSWRRFSDKDYRQSLANHFCFFSFLEENQT